MPDSFIINAGSHIGASTSGDGWTNTYLGAEQEARSWLREMNENHIDDVELVLPGRPSEDAGRWVFGFRHRITGVTVELETHGIDNQDAYGRQRTFYPRVYWNGSSTGNPEIEDWAAPGFVAVKTFRVADDTETRNA